MSGFALVRLGNVVSIDRDQRQWKGRRYVGLESIESNSGRLLSDDFVETVKSTTFGFDERHVLYGRLRPYLNKVLLPDFEGHCSTEIFPLLASTKLDRRYLWYWLTSANTVEAFDATCTGARMPRANMDRVLELEIPLPPLEEQRRIVAVLDEAFAAIATATANAEKNLANSHALPSGQLTGLLKKLDEIKVIPVSEVAFIQEGPGIRKYEYQDDGFPMINVRCVQDGWIDMSKSRAANIELANGKWRHFQVEDEDILFTTSGTIGRCAIAGEDDLPLLMNTSVVRFRSESNELIQKYLYHFLRSDLFQRPLLALASGTAIANVGPTHIKTLSISMPNVDQQKLIVDLLDETISLSANLVGIYQSKIEALNALKQSLLDRAFSGELSEREPLAA